MRFKKPILSSVLIVAMVFVAMVFLGHGVTPSIAIPDTVVCPAPAGSTVNQAISGVSFSSVMGWQLNITYDHTKVSLVSVALGPSWNGINHSTAMKNATGSLLYGYTTLDSAVLSGNTTLLTLTWKFLVSPGSSTEHLVLTTQNTSQGTMLLDATNHQMSYTTTDGGLNIYPAKPCPNIP